MYIDFTKPNQILMSIRVDGQCIGYVEIDSNSQLCTTGDIGECVYDNFVDLIKGLQGFNIKIDNFYF